MVFGTRLSLLNMRFEDTLEFIQRATSISILSSVCDFINTCTNFASSLSWNVPLLCVLIYYTFRSIYRLYFSPLRSIPGPWFAAISDLWLISHVLRLRRCRAVDDLFKTYGPIVRAAPNKVFFLDVPTMKHVYGASAKLSKSSFYKSLLTYVLAYFFASV